MSLYFDESPENFLNATSGAIHFCEMLHRYCQARTGDQWRPDAPEIKIPPDLQKALAVVVYGASRLQHNMGICHPDVYRAVFKQEPDKRSYEEWSKAQAEEMAKAFREMPDDP